MNTLADIGDRLRTQDNRITENPMFCVQEQMTVYGMHPDWSSEHVWIEDGDEVPEPTERGKSTAIRVGKYQYWRTVMAAFTEEGCREYLRLNGHNHRGATRIYVESWNRCPEMIAVREFLITKESPTSVTSVCSCKNSGNSGSV